MASFDAIMSNKSSKKSSSKKNQVEMKRPLFISDAISTIQEKLAEYPPKDMKCQIEDVYAVLGRFEEFINVFSEFGDGSILVIPDKYRYTDDYGSGFEDVAETWTAENRKVAPLELMIKHVRNSLCHAIQNNVGWYAWLCPATVLTKNSDHPEKDHLERWIVEKDYRTGNTRFLNIASLSSRHVQNLFDYIMRGDTKGHSHQLVFRADGEFFTPQEPQTFAKVINKMGTTIVDGEEVDGATEDDGTVYKCVDFMHVARIELKELAVDSKGRVVMVNRKPQIKKAEYFLFSSSSSLASVLKFLFKNKDFVLSLTGKFADAEFKRSQIERFFDEHFLEDGNMDPAVRLPRECVVKPEMVQTTYFSGAERKTRGVPCFTLVNPEKSEPIHFPVSTISYGTHVSCPILTYLHGLITGRDRENSSPYGSVLSSEEQKPATVVTANRFQTLAEIDGDETDDGHERGAPSHQWKRAEVVKKAPTDEQRRKMYTGHGRSYRPKARRGESADGEAELEHEQAAGGGGSRCVSNLSESPTHGRPQRSPGNSEVSYASNSSHPSFGKDGNWADAPDDPYEDS